MLFTRFGGNRSFFSLPDKAPINLRLNQNIRGLHLFLHKQSFFDRRHENCLSFSKKLPQKIV